MNAENFIKTKYTMLKNEHTINSFIGEFTRENVNKVLNDLKNTLNHLSHDTSSKKRVYHIVAESIENVMRHSYNCDVHPAFFVLNFDTDCFELYVGNAVRKMDSIKMKEMVQDFKMKDIDEIKVGYRKKIKETSISEKGGAGLGLFDIILKSNNKMEIETEYIDINSDFLITQVIIP